jgi:dynactin-6
VNSCSIEISSVSKMAVPLVKICEKALVCKEHTRLQGDILIGSKTVIHPTAQILAVGAPILIGDCNLIEEYVTIRNDSNEPMTIGSQNVFEVGCHVQSRQIGNNNVFESKCRVEPHFLVGSNCIIGAKCELTTEEQLPNNTVVYGPHCYRRVHKEKPSVQILQIDFLSKILPNYEKFEKPNWNSELNAPL